MSSQWKERNDGERALHCGLWQMDQRCSAECELPGYRRISLKDCWCHFLPTHHSPLALRLHMCGLVTHRVGNAYKCILLWSINVQFLKTTKQTHLQYVFCFVIIIIIRLKAKSLIFWLYTFKYTKTGNLSKVHPAPPRWPIKRWIMYIHWMMES